MRFFLVSIVCLSFFFVIVDAQSQQVAADSLLQKWNRLKSVSGTPDSIKLPILISLADQLNFDQPDSALLFFKEALILIDTTKNAKAHGDLLNKIGYTYYVLGEYDLALRYFVDALAIHGRGNNLSGLARSHNCIGLIYEAQGKFDNAIKELTQSVKYASESKDEDRLTSGYLNLGIAHDGKGQYDSAIYYSDKALQLAKKIANHRVVDMAYNRLGVIFHHQKKFKEAIESYNKSLGYSLYRNNWEECFTYSGLAKSYAALGELDKSIEAGLKGLALGKQVHTKWDLMEVTEVLSETYAMKGNFREAFKMQKLFKAYSDTVFNENKEQEINFLHLKQNEIENARLTNENELILARIRQKNMLVAFAVGAGLLLLILAFVLYRSNVQRRQLNEELVDSNISIAETNRKVEEQNQELNKLNQTKSQLLSIIGHDMRTPIHNIEAILQLIGEGHISQEEQAEVFNDLHRSVTSVADTMDNLLAWAGSQLKGVVTDPSIIELDEVVASQIMFWQSPAGKKNIKITHNLQVGLQVKVDVNHFKTVIRNLIGNAIKFTHERGEIKINYLRRENELGIAVADSGIGISPDRLKNIFSFQSKNKSTGTANEKGTGLGLMLSKEFIEKNNGRLEVQSELGKGSTFTIWLPFA